ncbi:unnamed protein product [Symbiodinium sp. CCMP2456]|nr:unnamed protein product [Symbiodinium sp. CCMP2456]
MYDWYGKHGMKQARKEREAPAHIRFNQEDPVMPGSLRRQPQHAPALEVPAVPGILRDSSVGAASAGSEAEAAVVAPSRPPSVPRTLLTDAGRSSMAKVSPKAKKAPDKPPKPATPSFRIECWDTSGKRPREAQPNTAWSKSRLTMDASTRRTLHVVAATLELHPMRIAMRTCGAQASMGHPIVCDVKYSSSHFKEDSQVTGGRLFLHAAFLRGTLPPDGIAPLSIACRLPRQLRECLTSMQRLRSLEETLSLEATELCDCLLMPDPEVVQKCDPGLEAKTSSKASSEKETEDPETEDLETEETEETEAEEAEEVAGVLSKRQMNELLNTEAEPGWCQWVAVFPFPFFAPVLGGDRSETDSESEANNELPEEVDEETNLDGVDSVAETDSGFGPMSLHSQFVRCKVCGEQEKVEKVEFPALRLRLSCRSVATWNAQVLKLFHSEEDREQGQHLQPRNAERWSNQDWTNEWSNRWWQQPCPEAWEWEWSSKSQPAPAKSGAGGGPVAKGAKSRAARRVAGFAASVDREAEKQNVEVQMRHLLCLLSERSADILEATQQLQRVRTIIVSCFGGRSCMRTSRTSTTNLLRVFDVWHSFSDRQPSCFWEVMAYLIRESGVINVSQEHGMRHVPGPSAGCRGCVGVLPWSLWLSYVLVRDAPDFISLNFSCLANHLPIRPLHAVLVLLSWWTDQSCTEKIRAAPGSVTDELVPAVRKAGYL